MGEAVQGRNNCDGATVVALCVPKLSGFIEHTDHEVVPVRIAECELSGPGARVRPLAGRNLDVRMPHQTVPRHPVGAGHRVDAVPLALTGLDGLESPSKQSTYQHGVSVN